MHPQDISLEPVVGDHLMRRARLRSAIECDGFAVDEQAAVATAEELGEAARVLDAGGDPSSVVAPEAVAQLVVARVDAAAARLDRDFFGGDLERIASAMGLGPELAVIAAAQCLLSRVACSTDGLAAHVSELGFELERIEMALCGSGEAGDLEEWAPKGR